MVQMTRIASLGARVSLALAVCILAAAPWVGAQTTAPIHPPRTDNPAAILVWPDIEVNTSLHKDTLVQLSNVDSHNMKTVHCFLVDADAHCSNNPAKPCTNAFSDCVDGGYCVAGCSESDFELTLTPKQPLAWSASQGLSTFPLDSAPHCISNVNISCTTNTDCPGLLGGVCVGAQNNLGSSVPQVPEDPFVGTLKCVELNNSNPQQFDNDNTLIGHATIETQRTDSSIDAAKYNAVGIAYTGVCGNDSTQACTGTCTGNSSRRCLTNTDCALEGGSDGGCNLKPGPDCGEGDQCVATNPPGPDLQIGGSGGFEYLPCATQLVLNHLFDDATDPISGGTAKTTLTLAPCGDDFEGQVPGNVTAQFLVYNEFEQRFSASRPVNCFLQTLISNIDTPNSSRSIFDFKTAGTLAGSTVIRGVGNAFTGRGLVGVATVALTQDDGSTSTSTAAYDLHEQGLPAGGNLVPDVIKTPGL